MHLFLTRTAACEPRSPKPACSFHGEARGHWEACSSQHVCTAPACLQERERRASMDWEVSTIKTIADTARRMAFYRALGSEPLDGQIRDRSAQLLAGERGQQIARTLPGVLI